MNPDEYINFENRYYQNPTLTRDETLSFVDSLRDTVQKDNASIAEQTQSLGTDVPSNLGGLTGSQGYFTQRYQTTPMEYQFNALKATAQADALNKLMNNYKAQAANRYNQAYRNAKAAAATAGNGNGDSLEGEPDPKYLTNAMTLDSADWADKNESNVTAYMTPDGYEYYKNMDTGKILKTNDPDYAQGSDGYWYNINSVKRNRGSSGAVMNNNPVSNVFNGLSLYSDKDYANMVARQQEAQNKQSTNNGGFFYDLARSFVGF